MKNKVTSFDAFDCIELNESVRVGYLLVAAVLCSIIRRHHRDEVDQSFHLVVVEADTKNRQLENVYFPLFLLIG